METTRPSVRRPIGRSARLARLPVVVAAIALPVLAGCSSTVEYATDAYPSQSLVDLLTRPKESPPPAPSAEPAPSATGAPPVPAPAAPPAREPPPVAATAAASPPPAEEADPVAAAYPSVSVIDLLTGARKPAP